MILRLFILTAFLSLCVFGDIQTDDVDKLLEKVHHAKTSDEKKELLEQLKKKLATKNQKAQQESDAIIKAKRKVPLKMYDESFLNSK